MRYHARWVLPITQPPIEDGTVVENDGVITYVGPRAAAPPGDDYELGESILLPGLVNTHTHLELTAMRGFLENCSFTAWIDKLRQSRNEVLSEEMLLDSARFGIVEGLEAGITTYADTCSSGVVMRASRACAGSCTRRRSAPIHRTPTPPCASWKSVSTSSNPSRRISLR
jgi:cytosine/adenosine deaminase-related metal-dependent hydrolase